MRAFRFGDRVEVHTIVAGGDPPLCGWSGRYRFSRYEEGRSTVLLWTRAFGRYLRVRYPLQDVRASTGRRWISCSSERGS